MYLVYIAVVSCLVLPNFISPVPTSSYSQHRGSFSPWLRDLGSVDSPQQQQQGLNRNQDQPEKSYWPSRINLDGRREGVDLSRDQTVDPDRNPFIASEPSRILRPAEQVLPVAHSFSIDISPDRNIDWNSVSVWPERINLDRNRQLNRQILKQELMEEWDSLPRSDRDRVSWLPKITKVVDLSIVPQSPRLPNGKPVRRLPLDKRIALIEEDSHKLPTDCGTFQFAKSFHANIFAAHNNFRRQHGVPQLEYSMELSELATDWARKLAALENVFDHRPNTPYGENIWFVRDIAVDLKLKYLFSERAVSDWYYERSSFDFGKPMITSDNGHFTQVIWKDTKKVGCGYAADRDCWKIYVVCNYSPIGNHYDRTVVRNNVLPLLSRRQTMSN